MNRGFGQTGFPGQFLLGAVGLTEDFVLEVHVRRIRPERISVKERNFIDRLSRRDILGSVETNGANMTTKPRTMELNGFKAEFIGPTRRIALFINDEWSTCYFRSIRSAKAYFIAYVKRHI